MDIRIIYSILDVADIVFVNPVNTGYSRILHPEADHKQFFGVNQDIAYLAEWINTFLSGETVGISQISYWRKLGLHKYGLLTFFKTGFDVKMLYILRLRIVIHLLSANHGITLPPRGIKSISRRSSSRPLDALAIQKKYQYELIHLLRAWRHC